MDAWASLYVHGVCQMPSEVWKVTIYTQGSGVQHAPNHFVDPLSKHASQVAWS